MNARTLIRSDAQGDIRNAVSWYESNERGLGRRFLIEVRTLLQLASKSPLLFPVIEADIRRALLRKFPYAIYFRLTPQDLIVVAVLHHRREPGIWLQR